MDKQILMYTSVYPPFTAGLDSAQGKDFGGSLGSLKGQQAGFKEPWKSLGGNRCIYVYNMSVHG